jgi:hypothetical protein
MHTLLNVPQRIIQVEGLAWQALSTQLHLLCSAQHLYIPSQSLMKEPILKASEPRYFATC